MNKLPVESHTKDSSKSKTRVKEKSDMEKNECIRCSVSQCLHNIVSEGYCSLGSISVGTHEADPTVPECTDCNSFVRKDGCCQ